MLVLTPAQRPVHHPYTDRPADGIHVLSYSFEEVFAEKMRALAFRSTLDRKSTRLNSSHT